MQALLLTSSTMTSTPYVRSTDGVQRRSQDKPPSNSSTHSILPSPPASPPLAATRTSFTSDRKQSIGIAQTSTERDVEANRLSQADLSLGMPAEAVEMSYMNPGSIGMTPMPSRVTNDSEHDPLLLRSKVVTDDEIDLRRRASRRAGQSRRGVAKLGE